jgi:hypothetical protein
MRQPGHPPVRDQTVPGRATPDRDRLWQRLSEQLDTYDGYQSKVSRRISLVRLTPVDHP